MPNMPTGHANRLLPALRRVGFDANRRLLDVQRISQDCALGEDAFRGVNEPVEVDGRSFKGTAVSMGNPHLVLFVDADPAEIDVERLGPILEYDARFPERTNVEFVAGDVRRLLPEVVGRTGRPDLLVLDPPRSGAGSRVMRKIVDTGAPRIVYVSCNPTTLAPDLGDLVRGGYAVRAVQPLDQFPHTYHVECAVLLERAGAPLPA